jgi:PAS domain S-box-containing protein
MPNPTTVRERRLRKTKAQLIEEINTLEQRAAAIEAANRSGAPLPAKAGDRYFFDRELADLARFPSENPNPVLRVMPDGTVLYANQAAGAVKGLLKGRKKSTLACDLAEVCAEASRTAEVQETEFESGDRVFAFSIAPVAGETYINIYGRDISREHAAKRELAEKEAQLRVALDSMPGGMMLGDRDQNYVLFNSQYSELFDFPDGLVSVGGSFRDELRYQADRGDFGPGDKDDLVEQVVATYQRGEAVSYEREIAGSGRTLQGYLAPTPEGGYVTIVNDITERKRAEAALRESEEQVRLLLNSTAEAIYGIDLEGNCSFANPACAEVLGLDSPKELLGKHIHDLIHHTRHDGTPYPAEECLIYQAFVRGEGTHVEDEVLWRQDGTSFPAEYWSYPIHRDGEVVGAVVTFLDITERRRAEEALAEKEAHLRVALDNMPGGMALFDRDLNYVLFNSQYSELFEYPDGLVRVGGSRRDVLRYQAQRGDFGPGDKDDVIEQVIATHRRGEAVSRERAIAGSGRTIQIYVAPTPEGGSVSIYTDITDRKRAEEELAAAYGIIKDQNERMESELNVGHEIQMSFIPDFSSLPDRTEFSICATLEPAREVGGDFYDSYFLDEERFCFCIADVSGKGVPAALFMAMVKILIKSRAADHRSTASILTHVNDELSVDNPNCMFVTVFAGILNIRSGELVYTNAGHNPPYIRKQDGALQRLDQRHGPAIGAMEGVVYKEERDTLEPGDLLFLYTDGVTEAMDVDHHLFSEDRLKDLLTAKSTKGVQTAVDHTVAAVIAFEGEAERTDDVTVLALEFHGRPEDALRAE